MFSRPSTGERKLKKAPFGSDKKVGENRKYFVRNISRLSQTNKQKTHPQHPLPARNTLEIKKTLIWLKTAEEPLLCDWQWHSSDTEGARAARQQSFAMNTSQAWCYAVPGFAQMTRKYSKLHSPIADLSTPCTQSMQLQLKPAWNTNTHCLRSLSNLIMSTFPHVDAIFLYGCSVHPHTISLSGIQKT